MCHVDAFYLVCTFGLQVWAVTGGSDGIADNFNELVPDMALDFPFELDAFQKEVLIVSYVTD